MISIHALREEGDVRGILPESYELISIHALREEGDLRFSFRWSMLAKFLSTPSARRATHHGMFQSSRFSISIHALREEGDGIG